MKIKTYVIVFHKAYDVEADNREQAKVITEDKLNAHLHDYRRPSDGLGITIKRT